MVVMTEEWVSLWYQCLTQNIDYGTYCTAKREGNAAQCAELEAQFEKIADVYNDFGELDGWPDEGMLCPRWKPWYESRRHLFVSRASEIQTPDQYVKRPGYLLIDVPLQIDEAGTVEAVKQFLANHYAGTVVVAASAPKYTLHTRNGRLAHGIVQVRQACRSVARSYRYDLETFEELNHHQAVAAFLRYEIDNMGWTLDPKARDELARTGLLSEQRLESFKAMLNRCRRDFRAFAANTIRARFPDNSPFESQVLDIF